MSRTGFRVVICGGGIAGVEALLSLRRLGGGRLQLVLVEPREQLVYRPLAVGEPFGLPGVRRYPLERIVSDTAAGWEKHRLAEVDLERREVRTDGGLELRYDALLLAVGANQSSPYEHAHVFTDRNAEGTFGGIVQDIVLGYVESIAFVLAHGPPGRCRCMSWR